MRLVDEIRAMQTPLDAEFMVAAVKEYVSSHRHVKSMEFNLDYHLVKDIPVKKKDWYGERWHIPAHWQTDLFQWAIKNGFSPEVCRGVFTIEW